MMLLMLLEILDGVEATTLLNDKSELVLTVLVQVVLLPDLEAVPDSFKENDGGLHIDFHCEDMTHCFDSFPSNDLGDNVFVPKSGGVGDAPTGFSLDLVDIYIDELDQFIDNSGLDED